LLQDGEIVSYRRIVASWNAIFLLEIAGGESESCLAVYKPCRGEYPLWDFPQDTFYKREHLAFRVSEALGWGLVPPTVVREAEYGVGSIQLFIEAEKGRHYFNLLEEHRSEMVRIAVYDILINNTDRKGGHVLLDCDGRLWCIDHGLSMLPEPKLRTVMWDLEGEAVPKGLKDDLARLREDDGLRDTIHSLLGRAEADAFYERAEVLVSSTTLPLDAYADHWRPYPLPTI
jgi:uncharacterized repeat protein (TIGR03843 family)